MDIQTIYIGQPVPYSPLVTLCLTVQQLLIIREAMDVHLETMDALDLWDAGDKIHYERALLLIDLELAKGKKVMTQERLLTLPVTSMEATSSILRQGMKWRNGRTSRVLDQAICDAREHVERLILSMAA